MALTTNWRASRTFNISGRDGNDTNTGGLADPFKTLEGAIYNNSVAIRSGYYRDQNIQTSAVDVEIYADGDVVIDPANIPDFASTTYLGNKGKIFNGIEFRNIIASSMDNISASAIGRTFRVRDCKLIDCNNMQMGEVTRTLIKGGIGNLVRLYNGTPFLKTTVISSSITFLNRNGAQGTSQISRSFFSEDTNIIHDFSGTGMDFTYIDCAFGSDGAVGFTGFDATNIGAITLTGDAGTISATYADGEKFSGVYDLGGGKFITFVNCFWTATPNFTNPANNDYTLNNSPQSILYNNGVIIGAYGTAYNFDINHPAFNAGNSGVIYTNLTNNGTNIVITSGTDGTVTTTDDPTITFAFDEEVTISDPLRFFGQFTYLNGEWIDKDNYNAGVNDEVRLTYRIQFYDENEPNGVNNILNWSPWHEMEGNMPIELDGSNLGNGDIGSDLTNLNFVTFRRFRLELTLRNNGV